MGPDPTPPGPRAALGPLTVWVLAGAASLLVAPPLAAAVPVAGAVGWALYRTRPVVGALVAVVAAAGICGPIAPGWALLGAALAIAVGALLSGRHEPAVPDPLEQHLARCRRSETTAALFVARCADAADAHRLAAALRLSDTRRTVGREVQALVDPEHLDRQALERRLAAFAPARFGWASFPETSPSLAGLVRQARAAMPEATAASVPVASVPAAPPAPRAVPGTAAADPLARAEPRLKA